MTSTTKRYRTVVIDFPWKLNLKGLSFRPSGTIIPYKTMTMKEIESFPINDYADEQSCLFLWVTHGTIELGFSLLKKWGFKYHCLFTWDKLNGLTICGITRRTEFVIYAYRGKMQLKTSGKSLFTYFREPVKRHSEKPNVFYTMLLKNTPEPRIDIFSRKKHIGFDSYGDQAEEPLTIHSFSTLGNDGK